MKFVFLLTLALMLSLAQHGAAQAADAVAYQPKFAGDKAHSEAEFSAMAYMRTAATAEKLYFRKHNSYAASLPALVGTGSFTKRMATTDRGDYKVSYRPKPQGQGYMLALTPRQFDPSHRSFYVDESGEFRAEEAKAATQSSPPLK